MGGKFPKMFDGWETLSGEERVNRFLSSIPSKESRFFSPLFAAAAASSSSSSGSQDSEYHLTLSSVSPPSSPSSSPSDQSQQQQLPITTFTYTIPHHYSNSMGNLHGGAAATIFDIATTMALAPISKPGYWMLGGVSRSLNVKYLRPAGVGERVRIVCEVVHAGKQMAALKGTMVRERDGAVLSICEHDKANTDSQLKAKL